MTPPTLDTLLDRVLAARASGASLAALLAELRPLWRDADQRFDAARPDTEAFRQALLDKWACRTLWCWLEEGEDAVRPSLRAELIATGLWTVKDAVSSSWAGTLR